MQENKTQDRIVLLAAIFLAGGCSIIYELLISSCSSYFLGDTIKQFSLIIGIYLASMGLGAYICKFFKDQYLKTLIKVEIFLGLIGGLSVPFVFFIYNYTENLQYVVLLLTALIGILTGTEIPLLTFLLGKHKSEKSNISEVLSLDYVGALLATILFPFVILPFLGIFKASILTGIVNILLAVFLLIVFRKQIKTGALLKTASAMVIILVVLLSFSGKLERVAENAMYDDRIIFSEQTEFQKIVVTKSKNDTRLYLNGNLQFSTFDEYRYHETLIHYPLSCFSPEKSFKVLILGGGDGLAVRELLKYPGLKKIDLIELDSKIIDIAKSHPALTEVNGFSLKNPKVHIHINDAFEYVKSCTAKYDLVVIDLPDAKNLAINKLYTKSFYYKLKSIMKPGSVIITQATSPYFARKSFWCIFNTLKEVFPFTEAIHTDIPSFGDWGFVLGSYKKQHLLFDKLPLQNLKFLNEETALSLKSFAEDNKWVSTEVNTLINPVLINYYAEEWTKW